MKLLFENWRGYLKESEEDDHADKIFRLITTGNGAMARSIVDALQINIDERFFEKYYEYAIDLIEQIEPGALLKTEKRRANSREAARAQGHPPSTWYEVIFSGDPENEAWAKLKSLEEGLIDFLATHSGWMWLDAGTPGYAHWQDGKSYGSFKNYEKAANEWAEIWEKSLDETPT